MRLLSSIFAASLLWSSGILADEPVAPVNAPCISSPFGPRIIPNHPQAGKYHYGIDLPVPEGTPVHAVAAGVLIKVQRNGPGGLEVLIQHDGFVGVYSHLGEVAPLLLIGRLVVAAGQRIGVVGHTGMTFGPHLYFGMMKSGRAIDPAPYLHIALCGGHGHVLTPAEILAAGGQLPPSRHYLGKQFRSK